MQTAISDEAFAYGHPCGHNKYLYVYLGALYETKPILTGRKPSQEDPGLQKLQLAMRQTL
jgi:hypothetical protein